MVLFGGIMRRREVAAESRGRSEGIARGDGLKGSSRELPKDPPKPTRNGRNGTGGGLRPMLRGARLPNRRRPHRRPKIKADGE